MNLLKAKDYRQRAWSALSGKWGAMAIIALIYMLISVALSGLSAIGIGAIALILVIGPLELGMTKCYIKVARGGVPQISEMFDGFSNFLRAFLLYLINTIFIALWSLLLVIPGIIKSYSYSMSFFILADNPGMDANEARKLSMKMMEGHKWRLFCLDFSFIGWMLLTILTFGILSFWVSPYTGVARAEFYEELLREQGISNNTGNQMNGGFDGGWAFGNGAQPAQPENKYGDPFDGFDKKSDSSDGNKPTNPDGDKPINADEL